MFYSSIGLIAIAILLIENQDILFHFGDGFDKPAWRVYRRFLIAVLVYYVTDVSWGMLESNRLARMLFLDTSAYFVAMAAGVALWTQYIVTYLDERGMFARLFLYAGRAIAVLVTFFTVVNLLYPVMFTVDEYGAYHALGFRYIILFIQIALLFLVSAYALSSIIRQQKTSAIQQRYRTLVSFGLIVGVCLIVQLLFPYLPMYALGYLLGTCLLRAFVIGDEKEEYRQELREATRVAELRQSIASLLDNMPAMSFSKDVETGAYLACNQSFAEYARRETPAGVVGLTDREIFDEDTAAHFAEDDRKALAMDRPYVFYEDVVDAAGVSCRLQTTKLKFYDSNGRMCLLGMSMDVTAERQAKEAYQKVLKTSTVYENIIKALSKDYFNLFYVDLETDDFIEYGFRTGVGQRTAEKHGTDFFAVTRENARRMIYEEDREQFIEVFEKETLRNEIDKNGMFIYQYRLLINGVPTYVNLKATRINGDDRHLIIGINNIDAQVKDRTAVLRAKEEKRSYLRLSALSGNLIVLYYVDPETSQYSEFSATKDYDELGIAKQGDDFFASTFENSLRTIHPDDQELFHSLVTKDNILRTIERDGIFSLDYRLLNGDLPTYVRLKAAMIDEDGESVLIIGLLNEDARIRREREYAHDLSVAKRLASIDALTGVKNKHAYTQWEERIDAGIKNGDQGPFAVVVCDINNMKAVNDLYGHYLQQLPMMASPRLRKPGAAVVQDVNGFGMAAPD